MPWTTKDVDRKKKGLSPSQKKKWVATANGVLKSGKPDSSAIRIANSVTKKGK